MKLKTLSCLALGCSIGTTVVAGDFDSGSKLYEFYGCANCHGDGGSEPVSSVVPNLAGKPANELYDNGRRILGGNGETREARLMHAALYSPSQCDSPPTNAELERITTWLSNQ